MCNDLGRKQVRVVVGMINAAPLLFSVFCIVVQVSVYIILCVVFSKYYRETAPRMSGYKSHLLEKIMGNLPNKLSLIFFMSGGIYGLRMFSF